MKKYLKWISIGLLALAVIGIILPGCNTETNTDNAANKVFTTDIDSAAMVIPEPPAEVFHWKKGEFVGSTGDVYLRYTDSSASFSDSEVTNGSSTIEVFLEKNKFWMRFDKYQNGDVESFNSYGSWWGVNAKFEDGTNRTESLIINDSSLEFSPKFSSKIIEELLDSNVVKFYLYDDYLNSYSFEINGFSGFNDGIEEYGW